MQSETLKDNKLIDQYAALLQFFLDLRSQKKMIYFTPEEEGDPKILEELKFHGTGGVSSEFVKNFGKLAGVSDIIFVDLSEDNSVRKHFYNARLINVETGTVLAVDQFTHSF